MNINDYCHLLLHSIPENKGWQRMSLGRWVVIDIETTGISEIQDQIIDLGFLSFEGTKLVRKYSSLVSSDIPISQPTQTSTGITQPQVDKAPRWKSVSEELFDEEGATFIAHNARFEEGFLEPHLSKTFTEPSNYADSIAYLALLNPGKAKLNLESFILENHLADKEEHRGLQDSIDLLKVMILETLKLKNDPEREAIFLESITGFEDDFWFAAFAKLSTDELLEIAAQIDFEPLSFLQKQEVINEDSATKLDQESLSFSGKNIARIFADQEQIKKVLPRYQKRDSQIEMSLKVGQSFNGKIHSLIQAPTGTGKTLAYMLPSALFALDKKEQVLISTATKALQKQALEKDYPAVLKILGLNPDQFKITHLIGSKNHYCELKFRKEHDRGMSLLRNYSDHYFKAYFDLLFFENTRGYRSFITREDFPYIFKMWSSEIRQKEQELAVDYRACAGHKCVYAEGCSYYQGIKSAGKADIILGNHSLTLNWPRSLTKPSYIVFDEAHKLESEATKSFSYTLSGPELNNFGKNLSSMVGPLYYLLGQKESGEDKINIIRDQVEQVNNKLEDLLRPLDDRIEKFFKKMPRYTSIYWNELPMVKNDSLQDPLAISLHNNFESIYLTLSNFYETLLPILNLFIGDNKSEDSTEIVALTALENFNALMSDLCEALSINLASDEEYSRSIRFHENDGYELLSAPINIGKVIYEGITTQAESIVLTSATLANAKGDRGVQGIEWSSGYSFVEPEKRFKKGFFLPEVFDYKKAKVIVATDTPSMYEPNYVTEVLKDVSPIIERLEGRTLLIYSSRARFEKAVEYLLEKFNHSIPVFIQGMGGNVVEDFKKTENGILIGMETFGEGIDIPGDQLKFVYIDKIPDLRMDLVTQKRRDFFDREFGNEFIDYYLSLRARSLHQKFGRLLRSETDSGAILVTDSRMGRWKNRTLGDFKKLMEPYELNFMKMKEASKEILDFFD